MNKLLLVISILIVSIIGCKTTSKVEFLNKESRRVENCRKNWKYITATDTIVIELLKKDSQGQYDMVTWPNFFIGINAKKDTIGIIDFDSSKEFKKRAILKFIPTNKTFTFIEMIDTGMDEPIFKVSKHSRENDLYCAVKFIYYGKIIK